MRERRQPHGNAPDVRVRRWAGLTLVAVGIGGAAVGQAVLPQILVWLLAAMLVWAGAVTWLSSPGSSGKGARRPRGGGWRRPAELKPGERYESAVKLTQVANVPSAEMICSRLKANGIEAFYKGTSPYGGASLGQAATDPAFPAEIWVGAGQVEQARQL